MKRQSALIAILCASILGGCGVTPNNTNPLEQYTVAATESEATEESSTEIPTEASTEMPSMEAVETSSTEEELSIEEAENNDLVGNPDYCVINSISVNTVSDTSIQQIDVTVSNLNSKDTKTTLFAESEIIAGGSFRNIVEMPGKPAEYGQYSNQVISIPISEGLEEGDYNVSCTLLNRDGSSVHKEEVVHISSTLSGNGVSENDVSSNQSVSNAVNSFNWKIYDKMDKSKNIFYSPYSIASALMMADLGATGTTESEIENMLEITDSDEFVKQLKEHSDTFPGSEKLKLVTANAMWIDKNLKVADNYREKVAGPAKEYLNAEIFAADFKEKLPNVQSEITKWVKDNTYNFIGDYKSIATQDTMADIVNAVYFYGEWKNKFKKEDTSTGTFHTPDSEIQTLMMHNHGYYRYVKDHNGITAIAIPYCTEDKTKKADDWDSYVPDSGIEMDILMPVNEQDSMAAIFDSSKINSVFDELDNGEETEIDLLTMPKFTMDETNESLSSILKSLGMQQAFTDNAEFADFANDLKVSDIAHRAKVEVDEEGSKAAAVTEMTMEANGAIMDESEPVYFTADRPFVFVIRDKTNNVILFTGQVINPQQNK